MPDTKFETAYEGFREARGNKFFSVLDSYVYLMAVLGNRYDEHLDGDGQWLVLITSDDFLHDAKLLARKVGLHVNHLGLTDSEAAELSNSEAIIIIEDLHGLVEVNYFATFEEAWELMDELYTIGISTTQDTQKRLDKELLPASKPRKKKKSKPKIMEVEDDPFVPIGANYD
jgi:hypothetical protein